MYALILYILSGLAAVLGKNDNRNHVQNKTGNNKPSFPIPLPVINVPPTLTNEERTKQEKKDRRDKWKFRLEIAGFLVLTLYAGFTIAIFLSTKKAADAAKESADTTAKQLELSQRPLMSLYPTINRGLSVNPDGAQIGIQVSYKNIGHSPAMKFWHNIEMLPTTADAISKREELCAQTKLQEAVNERMTDTIFPDEPFVQNYIVGVDKRAIQSASTVSHGYMLPVIIACVAYRPIFSDTVYATGRIFDVFVVDPEKPGILLAVNVKETTVIPVNRLFLSSHFEGATNVR